MRAVGRLRIMSAPFELFVGGEYVAVGPGRSTMWAAVRVEPRGPAVERERAQLALALVIDVSFSMAGDPIEQVRTSCELLAGLLGDRDQLALVTFCEHAGVLHGLAPVDADRRAALVTALRTLRLDGGTNIHAGLQVAAGLLAAAPAGLRRTMVLLSDGEPNVGLTSAKELAAYVTGLRPLGVSTLGFGVHHDEDVLAAIAAAGSGRYAYIPDPVVARVDLARAALAHGGIVADDLELTIEPADGVELVRVLPAAALRHGKAGAAGAIGDIFVDEGRLYAIELALDLGAGHRGRLARVTLRGRSPDGAVHEVGAQLEVDVRGGEPAIAPVAQREVLTVLAEAARREARAQADRGAAPAAVAILRAMIARIDARPWFVADDGSPLAELREQLIDEVAHHEHAGSAAEKSHRRKQAVGTQIVGTDAKPVKPRHRAPAPAFLVGVAGAIAGERFELMDDNAIGRGHDNDIQIGGATRSRAHARIVAIGRRFQVLDLGSTTGVIVNGKVVDSQLLADGDLIDLGDVRLRFEQSPPT
jgi:Ca-activated chloride channel family protein